MPPLLKDRCEVFLDFWIIQTEDTLFVRRVQLCSTFANPSHFRLTHLGPLRASHFVCVGKFQINSDVKPCVALKCRFKTK